MFLQRETDCLSLLWLRKLHFPMRLWFTVLTQGAYSSWDLHTDQEIKELASPVLLPLTPAPWGSWCLFSASPFPASPDTKSKVKVRENEAAKNRHESNTFAPIWGNHCINIFHVLLLLTWPSPRPHIYPQSFSSSIDVIAVILLGNEIDACISGLHS